jgi:TonB family protein
MADERQSGIVVTAGCGRLPPSVLREVRGPLFNLSDSRFPLIALLSILLHGLLIYVLHTTKVKPVENLVIEKVPERFAKLIVEKPIPKEKPTASTTSKAQKQAETEKSESSKETPQETEQTPEQKAARRVAATKKVAARAARVEKKIRTVGVLGMLTGTGATAKGPSVVDVLGKANKGKESFQDLEKQIADMGGLSKAKDIDVLDKKLVKSKDIAINHKESIDDLIAGIGAVETKSLSKKGDFVIQRPQSIEGAASSSAKRDNSAINRVVSSHKTSVRMSYEKYLKRDPNLAGKITVRFTIAADGSVSSVQVLENSTGSKSLERDIVRKIRMWRFEAVQEGNVTVTYPFVFRPA